MAFHIILILKAAGWISRQFGDMMTCIRSFQEVYSTSGMGLFVNIPAETHEGRKYNLEHIDTAIKAHMILTPFPLIYNLHWEEIRNTPHLAAYFEQFADWKQYIQIREETSNWWEWTLFIPSFLTAWAGLFKDAIPFQPLQNLIANPYLFITPIKAKYVDKITIFGGAALKAMESLIAQFSTNMHAYPPLFIHPTLCRKIHPLLDLEWTVMKTAITQLYTYDCLLNRHPEGWSGHKLPVPYVPGQKFHIRDKGTSILWTKLQDSGQASIPIPDTIYDAQIATEEEAENYKSIYGDLYIHIYQLDSHGIKSPLLVAMGIADVVVHPTGAIPTEGSGVETNTETYVTLAERVVTNEKKYHLAKVMVPMSNAHWLEIYVNNVMKKRYIARKEDSFIMFYLYNEVTLEGDDSKKIELKAKAVSSPETLYGFFYGEEV